MKFFTLCIPFLPFAAVSVYHLVCCLAGWQRRRAVSKLFLMPLLLGGYLLSAAAPIWLLAAGLAFGFLGDAFLLLPNRQWAFLAGLGSFLLGHVCYSVMFAQKIAVWSPAVLVPIGFGLAAVAVCAFLSLQKQLGRLRLPAGCYLVVIAVMAFFALAYAFSQPDPLALAAIPGGLLFLASDYMLARHVFGGGSSPRGDFWVMLTYLLAQAGIVLAAMA